MNRCRRRPQRDRRQSGGCRPRRHVVMSTTFRVLQAQRDLANAETAELRARLDYRTALAEFDRVQLAP